ncbi:uncharacterized protein EV420DRAFT_1649906 [Desarmillaria tabescens]|uniref:Uncharacterized protein n=1 Tax=Armillaria tabescens TaxID=1929756 RepID=A0AA39MPT3_ARMTA|nr:uncharacterized protein EV420DRAFT_1649906 [Desarmillaria tabescens]KAK0441798.1 hypothetical protein EV420DRAFT_1649906 [Desarmillaria tabescens]
MPLLQESKWAVLPMHLSAKQRGQEESCERGGAVCSSASLTNCGTPIKSWDLILDFMEPMTREEEEELRLRLRTAFVSENNENMFSTPFNMCEH